MQKCCSYNISQKRKTLEAIHHVWGEKVYLFRLFRSSDVTRADHGHVVSCNKVHPGWYRVFGTNHCLRWHVSNRELIEWSFPHPFLLLAISLKNSLEVDSQLLSCLLLLDLFISLYNIILFAVSNSRGEKNKRKKKHIYCWIKGHLKDFFKLCSILSTFNSLHYTDVYIWEL